MSIKAAREFRAAYGMTVSEACRILQLGREKVARLHLTGSLMVDGGIIMVVKVSRRDKVSAIVSVNKMSRRLANKYEADFDDKGYPLEGKIPVKAVRMTRLIEEVMSRGYTLRQACAVALSVLNERKKR